MSSPRPRSRSSRSRRHRHEHTPRRRWPWGRIAMVLALCLVVVPLVAAWFALQGAPAVNARPPANADDIGRAMALLKTHDPRRQVAGQRRQLELSAREVDLVVHHVAQRLGGAHARVAVIPQQARLVYSLPLPWGRWLNVDLELLQTSSMPKLHVLRVGPYNVPPGWAQAAAGWVLRHTARGEQALQLVSMVQRVWFDNQGLRLQYAWNPLVPERLLAAVVPPTDQARIRAYTEHLVRLTQPLADNAELPLSQLMSATFKLARERSVPESEAAAENRAALLVLALYARHHGLANIVPASRQWPAPRQVPVLLDGREDLALHLLISAVLAVESSSPLSKVIGVYKEVADSRGGSGFSFDDLAADRVGTRLGEMALKQPQLLQQRLSATTTDSALMPVWKDLPTGLSQAEFAQRFGAVGSPAYEAVISQITQRVEGMALWRP